VILRLQKMVMLRARGARRWAWRGPEAPVQQPSTHWVLVTSEGGVWTWGYGGSGSGLLGHNFQGHNLQLEPKDAAGELGGGKAVMLSTGAAQRRGG
jgi:hypothetical protein